MVSSKINGGLEAHIFVPKQSGMLVTRWCISNRSHKRRASASLLLGAHIPRALVPVLRIVQRE